jgi:S1-C subfamily serine protease
MTPSERDQKLDAAIAAYYQAIEAGRSPDREAFLAEHADLRTELESFLDDKAAFEGRAAVRDPNATLPPGSPTADAPDSPWAVVRYFGDYELLTEIARGGMGVVYRARQVSLNRIVALKMILAGQLASPADVQRFRTEAEAAANLDHPNILPVYEVGEHEGQQYFSMKLVDGGSLADRTKEYVGRPPDAAALVATVARAVHHAHLRGVLHRDLKPANILLDADGTPFVTDFGLAKRVEGDSGLTAPGVILGTPSYMAPEQARAENQLTAAVDIYALGAILYECLTGRPPFAGPTPFDTVLQVLDAEAQSPRSINPKVPRDLETVALKCLRKDPAKRYGSAAELADDLRRWQAGEPVTARPQGRGERLWRGFKRRRGAWLIAGGSATFTLLLAVVVLREDRPANPFAPSPPPTVGQSKARQPVSPFAEVASRTVRSTAQIRVTLAGPRAYGSGWVAERTDRGAIVITNAHVVGMKEPASLPPEKIEVLFDAGTPSERQFIGKLTGVDRENNLAVIAVEGKDLPPALSIVPSARLTEAQKLLVTGFPTGQFLSQRRIAVAAKAQEMTVAGRIFNRSGSVKYIQTEGGADPGASGASAVDTSGNVRGVLLAGDYASNMRWLIPSECVVTLLEGRVQEVIPGQAVRSGAEIKQPMSVTVCDPLRRLRQVTADVWAGRPGEIRPGGDRAPGRLDGDGPAVTVAFDYDPERRAPTGEPQGIRGEVTLPPIAEDQVYWFRPNYAVRDGRRRWGEAVPLEMSRFPVDAKPARLAANHTVAPTPDDAHPIELTTREVFRFEITPLQLGSGSDLGAVALLEEQTSAENANGEAKIRLSFRQFRLTDSDADSIVRRRSKGALESIKNLRGKATVGPDGRWQSITPDVTAVPVPARPILLALTSPAFQTIEGLSLSLPGKEMQPNETWPFAMRRTVKVGNTSKEVQMQLTAKYLGRRVRDRREEAVIELTGLLIPGFPGSDRGFVRGAALVDLTSGQVTLAFVQADLDVPISLTFDLDGLKASADVRTGIFLEMLLRRGLTSGEPPAMPAGLLPYVRTWITPWVGIEAPPARRG